MKKEYKEKTLYIINNILSRIPFTFHIKGLEGIYEAINNIKSISSVYNEYTNYFEKQWKNFFINGMLNYFKINKKMRTNNTIENYN